MKAAVLFTTAARRAWQDQVRAEAARGRAFAIAWRERMKPFFDAIYGAARAPSGSLLTQREEAERGRQFAARWRREQPARVVLDRIYGPERAR